MAMPAYCLWIEDRSCDLAECNDDISGFEIASKVSENASRQQKGPSTEACLTPHQFRDNVCSCNETCYYCSQDSSERRDLPPCWFFRRNVSIATTCLRPVRRATLEFGVDRFPPALVWIANGLRKLEEQTFATPTRSAGTPFPLPTLTEKNKADLTRCAEDILLAREAHFPATIADLYDPRRCRADLREAHERNDEVLERIYIGRRFRNDTERLEKLFELYTKMTAAAGTAKKAKAKARHVTTENDPFLPFRSPTPATGSSTKVERARHAADAGARLREARRAVSAHQVAAGLGQEPGADVHRARQARTTRDSSRQSSSCRRRPSARASTMSR